MRIEASPTVFRGAAAEALVDERFEIASNANLEEGDTAALFTVVFASIGHPEQSSQD